MQIIRSATQAEVVLSFLQGEFESSRFGEELRHVLDFFGFSHSLISDGDFCDTKQNEDRLKVFKKFRGFPDQELFERFPQNIEWNYVQFSKDDFFNCFYINYSYWNELSDFTSKPTSACKNILAGKEVFDVSNENFLRGKELLGKMNFPPVILISCNLQKNLIIEGHSRMTIYGFNPDFFEGTFGYVGKVSPEEMKLYDSRMI
ncbi:MAG: hypothetical protein J6R03_01040 [Treponema sp.]|nr:hypothetical protein [Treponema sp.]